MQHPNDTIDDEQLSLLLDKGWKLSEIGLHLGFSYNKLAWRAKKLGLKYKHKYYSVRDTHIREIIDLYSYGFSSNNIAEIYNCSNDCILRILKIEGQTIKTPKQKKFYRGYTLNKSAFEDLTTEETAYFYGWLLTDGCLSKVSVSIELASKDEDLLINLKSYMNSSNIIRRRSRTDKRTGNTYHQSSFAFSEEEVVDRLKALGLGERKSLKERCPEVFKHNHHFWRGVIEGDGHISSKANKLELCGSAEICQDFLNYCKSIAPECNPRLGINGKMHTCSLSKFIHIKQILDSLYSNSKYVLQRKYKIYLEKYCADDAHRTN